MFVKFPQIVFITLLLITAFSIPGMAISREYANSQLDLELDSVPTILLCDAFIPMSLFKPGDILISATPVYLHLPLGSDKDVEDNRDDFTVKAVSVTAGYAFTEKIFINTIYTYAKVSGTLGYDQNESPLVRLKGDQTIQSYLIAGGYDSWKTDESSISLMFGAGQRFYKVDMDVSSVWYPSDCVVKSDSSSMIYFLGIAYSKKFSFFDVNFKVSPYLYYFHSGGAIYQYSSDIDPAFNYSRNGMGGEDLIDGFHFSYLMDNISFSLSVNSELSGYYYKSFDNLILDGFHMLYVGAKELAYAVSVSYTL